ncbi:MAG: UDP-N-acetylmuramoyl-L-alanyl-D-glutamate--2,6-diaminopimelate ligase [Dehalococcoidia bacterium]|nr:UDP-N-acetylmuramoyl-L-alanyl-D-glutamate--2,6-diaminopimelate ligase [Dehalococcoidia bacterium]
MGPMTARGDWREGLPAGVERAALPPAAGAIRHDSREVRPGDVFVCIRGERADGHVFAPAAVSAGAVALVAQAGHEAPLAALGVPVAVVPDTRVALAALAVAHEGYPGRRLTVVGVTGTDGKSTTAAFTLAALEGCGLRAGLLTTVGTCVAGRELPNPTRLTTQEAPYVQHLLAEMVEAGCTHAVVEATSHGLALHRLDGCEFDVAVLTNLSPDHLDFHGSFEAYRAAKARLFAMLDEPTTKPVRRVAVLNADDAHWGAFARATHAEIATYGLRARSADVRAREIVPWPDGSTFVVTVGDESVEASVRLPGRFNVANATAAIAVAAVLGLDPQAAAAGVAGCAGVPGRMERIEGAPFAVVVDYAHTPEAMRQVLAALRELVEGRLIVVFGCAGERARERRSGIGAAVAELADYAVVTEEDPRSEPPEAIAGEIAQALIAGGAAEGERFERVPERRAAIARAIALARPGDLVLLAGKGHESTIERAGGPLPWDERAVARALIAERFGAAPP